MNFNDLFRSYNAKNLRTRVNYIERDNPRLLNGVAVEDVFQKMFQEDGDKKIFWFVKLRNMNILYIETYENELEVRGEKRWCKAWDFCDKVVFILLNPYTRNIRVREYGDENKIIEYPTLDDYIYAQYKVNCTPHIQELFESINKEEIISNPLLDNYVNYIEREEKDTLLYRMDSLIFGDLWAKLKKEENEFDKVFYMNFDMVLTPNHIVECKGKTRLEDEQIIINNWEFSILSMLVHQKKRVTLQIMLSDDEQNMKTSLLIGNGIANNVDVMYLELTDYTLNLFISSVAPDGTKIKMLNKQYFTIYRHPYIDELKQQYVNCFPYIFEAPNRFAEADNQMKNYIINAMTLNNVLKQEDIQFRREDKVSIGYLGNKKIVYRFVEQVTWKIWFSKEEIEKWKEKGIDYIFIFVFYRRNDSQNVKEEDLGKSHRFFGYTTIDDFVKNANELSNIKGNRGNQYRYWLKQPKEFQIADIAEHGIIYSYSLYEEDVLLPPELMKPYTPLKPITADSYNDFH